MHVSYADLAALDAGARALHVVALECELHPNDAPAFCGMSGHEAAAAALAQARQLAELESRLRAQVQR